MTKSNLLGWSALSLLVAAGLAQACGGTKEVWVSDPDETAGSSSTGKAGAKSTAGASSFGGEPASDAGSAGMEEMSEAGAPASGSGGTAGVGGAEVGGTSGSSGTSGVGGSAGLGGSAGTAGSAGNAGKGGSGGTPGGGASGTGGSAGSAGKGGSGTGGSTAGGGGTAGKGGAGGTSGAGGSGGAITLFTPASSTCSAGNVDSAFSVCRNCHGTSPSAPISLVTFAQITLAKESIIYKLTNNLMPPPGSGTLSTTNKNRILDWLSAGAVGVPYTNGACP